MEGKESGYWGERAYPEPSSRSEVQAHERAVGRVGASWQAVLVHLL